MPNYYEILGVPEDVDADLLDDALRAQQKIHHPDRGGSVEMSALINVAYDILSNPLDRAAYDRTLREERTGGSTRSGADGRAQPSRSGPASDPWDDWDTYASPGEPERAARETGPEPGSPTHWLRGPMPRAKRLLGIVVTVLLAAFAFIVAAVVRDRFGSIPDIDPTDRTSIVLGLLVAGGFLVVGLSVQGLSLLAHRRRQSRNPTFHLGPYPSGGVVFVAVSAILVGLIGVATLPQFGADGGFPASASEAEVADETMPTANHEAPTGEVTGQAFAAGRCRTQRSDKGRLLPDPDCSPGTTSDTATVESLCAAQYRPPRPSDAAIVQARTTVAQSYAKEGVAGSPSKVAFLVPLRLGGTWNLQNMWPRGALVATGTVDKVLAQLCAPGSTLTLAEVQSAAVRNDLAGLVNR